ncbi:MAG: PD40 domain-containing protein, partial [Chloroflexi bacterium]|nr:PD40 domain-containing protein [Chloroflexota bacterium]
MNPRRLHLLLSLSLGLVLVMAMGVAAACGGPATAAFQASSTSGQAPFTVTFTNQSANADEFTWDFGDGQTQTTTSKDEIVTHEFRKAGTLTVTLTAGKKGKPAESASTKSTLTVAPGIVGDVTISPTQATLEPLGKKTFAAEVRDVFGNVIPDAKITFKADEKAGQISESGNFTAARKVGNFDNAVTVEAAAGNSVKSASARIAITTGPLDHVALNPDKAALDIGKSQDFTVSAFDAFDNPVSNVQLAWSFDQTAGALDNGKLTAGTRAGSFEKAVSATATQGALSVSTSASVTVRPDVLDSISVPAVSLVAGASKQVAGAAKDKFGNPLTDVQWAWSVTNSDAGAVSSSGSVTAGLVAGSFPGTLELKGTQGAITKSAASDIAITPGPLSQVVVGPGQIDLGMDMQQQFVAVGADQYGNRISGLTFNWSVEAGGGTISKTGLFTATSSPGAYANTIKASAQAGDITKSGTAGITIEQDRIAFFSTGVNEDGDLYIMNANGTGIVRISEGIVNTSLTASWSPDGRRIALDSQDSSTDKSNIIISDDSGDRAYIISGGQDAIEPAWSPDGARIAYTGLVEGHVEILVMDVDGGNVRRLTDNTTVDRMPAWSPDGKQIAFVATRDGYSQIYVMNADGSKQRRLVNSFSADIKPAWSPDGTRIAFQTSVSVTVWSIRVINVDGSGLRQLTPSNINNNFPSWAADSKMILFHSWADSQHPGIYKMSAEGGPMTRISGALSEDYGPIWAPRKRGVPVTEASIIIPNSKTLKALTAQEIAANSRKAIVRIETDLAKGSGFIIDPAGTIITANHVVTNAKTIDVFLWDGTKYTATVKGRDMVRDIAVLQVNAGGLPFLKMG